MGVLQLNNPSHPSTLLQRANQLRLTGTLCDVIITVDGHEFPAHRTVLACTSKMFEILFHRSSLRYALDFLSPKTFQQILEYAYTASLQATAEDLDDLLYAAEILEIEYLEEQCLKVLETIQAEESEEAAVRNHSDHGRARHWRHMLMSKKHSIQGGSNCATPTDLHHLALYHMTERSSPGPEPDAAPELSPKLGIEVNMESSEQAQRHGKDVSQDSSLDVVRSIKSEHMQVDDASSCEGRSSSAGEGSCMSDQPRDEGPGTPLRGSVITSARELHTSPEDGGQVAANALEIFPGITDKHLASIYSMGSNHTAEGLPVTISKAPSLVMPLDPRAYGGLLHQGLRHRELLSRLGQFAAGMRHEGHAKSQQCCGECGLQLHSRQAIEQHRRLHNEEKGNSCEYCGKHFQDSMRLRMHTLSHTAPAEALVCDQCGATFSSEDALEAHRQTHTGTDMAVFCLLCAKRFQTQKALQQHMEVHAGMHSYICSHCERPFPSHTTLKRHLRSHTGDHPFECEFCGSCFRDDGTLRGHKRIHTGEKPYECNGCGKRFSLKHQLETHYRVHTGEKPFECKLCHQRSRDYSAMIKHLRTHNGASPYQCTICQDFCPSLAAMQKHMKGHKPEEVPADWRIEKTYLYVCYV
ncbi:zinc finger and BTB domain-containing protein 16-A [Nothobranchius furzeri]|uniref:Zinc finger and BTB domain-containing protein 16-A-like n=1 Tax=Nothobranchius furzeri TaxID=105023 RepID=A0A1A8VGC5_NOTFU|nr:zinc finger and BTB domain-containing protein 16-A [Nothobranchius furzeri]XP_054598533.1 zinc finger and BTB domain-containing protein 16-A [Nothobranchius furzeri]KAF7218648.1 zinc finger and BTB domain-containing protein 16-A-like [Nothobranchius furzeri]